MSISKKTHAIFIYIAFLIIGIIIGGYLFSHSQPRSFLAVDTCQDRCYKSNELKGLLVSAGIQIIPQIIPKVIFESDKTIVMESPNKETPIHYVAIPKKDIRDASDLTEEDKEYLTDIYSVFGKIIREKKLVNYRIVTNGNGYQDVTYLHFHLLAK